MAQKSQKLKQVGKPVASGKSLKKLPVDLPASGMSVSGCPACGSVLAEKGKNENCPSCGSRARQRCLTPLLNKIIKPILPKELAAELPLLSFAMTPVEQQLLEPAFSKFKSVSLYGEYRVDHEVGVDARDLTRYADNSFSGAVALLVYDYFVEQDQALAEVFRVTAPGGVFFTCFSDYRMLPGSEAPFLDYMIVPRPNYFEYVPAEKGLPSIKVGQKWFVEAMRRAGFLAEHVPVHDSYSGMITDWFIGQKPGWIAGARKKAPKAAAPGPDAALVTAAAPAPAAPAPAAPAPAAPAIAKREQTEEVFKTYSTPVDPAYGFKRVVLKLSCPAVPLIGQYAGFAEHAYDSKNRVSTDSIVAVQPGGVVVSEDLGKSWDYVATPETGKIPLWNAYTMADKSRLLQGLGPQSPQSPRGEPDLDAPIFRCDANWKVIERVQPAKANWQGTRAIDEMDGTLIFAEYPENLIKYSAEYLAAPEKFTHLAEDSRVFRSRDGGRTWTCVFTKTAAEIRHFHTVIADPWKQGHWWISSGDAVSECRVWRSTDDGINWDEATGDASVPTPGPAGGQLKQALYRHTDAQILENALIWGSDDYLAPGEYKAFVDASPGMATTGSRVFISPKTVPLAPTALGFVGNPIRSIIDVGQGYLVVTEAKNLTKWSRPQVCLLSKTEPYLLTEIATLDNFEARGTGLTFSRASRSAKNGVFFSFRNGSDVFPEGSRILKWEVDFV
jgi:Methyltransferase domain